MKKNLIFILVFIFLTGYALPEKKKEIKKQRKNLVKKAIDWKMKGLRAYSSRDFEGAIEYYSKALEVDPKDSDAYEFLGQLYSIRKNFDKAIINYSMVLKFEPKNLNVLLGRGNIYLYYLKKPDKALKNYSKIIEIDPKHSMAFNNRSGVYLQYRHELELAFSDLSKSIELDPKYADAYGNRACVYFFKGDFKKAEKDLVAFLKYGSNNNPYSKYRRLWKYLATKRSGGAENGELSRFVSKLDDSDWINAVLMLFNNDISVETCLESTKSIVPRIENERKCEAYYFIGQYYLLKGNKTKAKEYFKKCIDTKVTFFLEYLGAKEELKRL